MPGGTEGRQKPHLSGETADQSRDEYEQSQRLSPDKIADEADYTDDQGGDDNNGHALKSSLERRESRFAFRHSAGALAFGRLIGAARDPS